MSKKPQAYASQAAGEDHAVSSTTEKVGNKVKRAGAVAASTVTEKAESIAEEAMNVASARAETVLETGQMQAENLVRSIGRAFEAGSVSLERDGMSGTAGYVRAAANGLKQAANEVDGLEPRNLTSKVENFVRDRPLLTVGALAVAGFVLASTIKARDSRS